MRALFFMLLYYILPCFIFCILWFVCLVIYYSLFLWFFWFFLLTGFLYLYLGFIICVTQINVCLIYLRYVVWVLDWMSDRLIAVRLSNIEANW